MSNTPPSTSKNHPSPFQGGEDYLAVFGTMLLDPSASYLISNVLDDARRDRGICHTTHDGIICHKIEAIRRGKFHYPLGLSFRECTLAIQPEPSATGESFWSFTASGVPCLRYGAQNSLLFARSVLESLGCVIEAEKLSRVDLCLDLPGINPDVFVTAARERRYIMQSRTYREIESTSKTVILGKDPLSVSIYDRLAVVKRKPYHRELMDLMMHRRWNGIIPSHATRIEFRLRRDALKRFGIDKPYDYFKIRGDLVHHLCHKSFRFTEQTVDRRNTTRATILPLWHDVANGFAHWAGRTVGGPLRPLPKKPANVSHLIRQAYGLVQRIARERDLNPIPFQRFDTMMQNQLIINWKEYSDGAHQ